jgi:hypothetical protein
MQPGDFKHEHETYDEYCSRVDDEIRAAGEYRWPLWATLAVYALVLAIIAVNVYVAVGLFDRGQ